jgi:hypothetical protein
MRSQPFPTWDEISQRVDVTRCRGLQPNGMTCFADHTVGETNGGCVAGHEGCDPRITIHWSDRRVTYVGIRRFLRHVARAQVLGEIPSALEVGLTPEWLIFFRTQQRLTTLARQARVRIPKHLSDDDRAKMRALIANVPRTTSNPLVPEGAREKARMWARR